MQCAVIEYGRNVIGLQRAHSTEFDKDTLHPVICLLDEQREITQLGGTMRLGSQPAVLEVGSHAMAAYGQTNIAERHRHRYEFNNVYRDQFRANGMKFTGTSPDGGLVEIVELDDHPWFLAVQFHPEFKSKPTKAHPLFAGFIKAAIDRRARRQKKSPEDVSPSEALLNG
jgi:CTP synthase